jgi:hypothetical protein
MTCQAGDANDGAVRLLPARHDMNITRAIRQLANLCALDGDEIAFGVLLELLPIEEKSQANHLIHGNGNQDGV